MKKSLLMVLGLALLSTQALASAGDAGCGLGSLVIQKNTKISQTFAMTTNATFLSQFFGITSGTSNCTANSFAFQDKEAQMFAESNIQSLKVDMAKGHGESLTAFAQILGCKHEAIPAFGHMTQSKYEAIFPSTDVAPVQVLKNVHQEINNTPALKASCAQTT